MTNEERKALLARLRDGVLYGDARLHNPKGHDPLRMKAADQIEADGKRIAELEAEVRAWRECALHDATMEGPMFKGWDRSALDRCRRAALGEGK